MAFTAVAASDIAVDQPLTNELLTQYKDNDDYLYGQLSAISAGLINPSFEVDSDSDGIPDSWEVSLYAGGAASLATTIPSHGEKAMKFVHPGGAGNGAGIIVSDYIPISTITDWRVSYDLRSTVDMFNGAQIYTYKSDKIYIEYLTLRWAAGISPSTINGDYVRFSHLVTPSASARYAKIVLMAGATGVDVAGDAYYDNVFIEPIENYSPGTDYNIDYGYGGVTGTTVATILSHKAIRKGIVRVEWEKSTSNPSEACTVSVWRNGSVWDFDMCSAASYSTGVYVDVVIGTSIKVLYHTTDVSNTGKVSAFVKCGNPLPEILDY